MRILENPVGVSFLLCTYNGATRITETLRCLAKQNTLAEVAWEVIFVDNASTDDTTTLAQQIWIELGYPAPLRLMYEPRPGYKVAMERAIGQIKYRYACIVDDDNRLAEDYLQVGLGILENNPRIGILGGQNTATFESQEPEWFTAFQHCYAVGQPINRAAGSLMPMPDGNVGRNVLWGAGMFVRSRIWTDLQEVGFKSLFTGRQGEKNLTAGEDDELCYIAQLIGYEVWYSSRLHLQHHMTAGRLTVDYRDRLFYGSARTAARLNAYRNALWGKLNSPISINLHKDTGYLLIGLLKNVASSTFIKSYFTGDYTMRMNQWHTLIAATDIVKHYRLAKNYYKQVLDFKQRALLAQKEK
jgi:glycosyltransferase involved in cell wall biosynthesis